MLLLSCGLLLLGLPQLRALEPEAVPRPGPRQQCAAGGDCDDEGSQLLQVRSVSDKAEDHISFEEMKDWWLPVHTTPGTSTTIASAKAHCEQDVSCTGFFFEGYTPLHADHVHYIWYATGPSTQKGAGYTAYRKGTAAETGYVEKSNAWLKSYGKDPVTMRVADAKAHCSAEPTCKGFFYYAQSVDENTPVSIWWGDTAETVPGQGYTTFVKSDAELGTPVLGTAPPVVEPPKQTQVTSEAWRLYELTRDVRRNGFACPANEGSGGEIFAPYPNDPLWFDCRLWELARGYAFEMAQHHFFGHKGPEGSTPVQRAAAQGVQTHPGENLAKDSLTPEATMRTWLASSSHCRNIMNPGYTRVGTGFALGSDPLWVLELSSDSQQPDTSCYRPSQELGYEGAWIEGVTSGAAYNHKTTLSLASMGTLPRGGAYNQNSTGDLAMR